MSVHLYPNSDLEAQFSAYGELSPKALWHHFGAPQACLVAIADHLQNSQKNLLDFIDCPSGSRRPEDWDVCDPDGYFHWFYHRHAEEKNCPNHAGGGHFHLFASPKFFDDSLGVNATHLIAIELDRDGDLNSLFVPNIWVTQENPRPSWQLKSALQKFDARQNTPNMLISIWLAALTRTFLSDITRLLEQRDRFLSAMPLSERKAYFNDRSIERICEWKLD